MVLRPQADGCFKVVGECYIHGLCDATAFLRQLATPWIVQLLPGRSGMFNEYCFKNTETGQATNEDPRLGPLPGGWERLDAERSSDDPEFCEKFRNTVSGEVLNSDPRLEPEALKARGVGLTEFVLI